MQKQSLNRSCGKVPSIIFPSAEYVWIYGTTYYKLDPNQTWLVIVATAVET